MSVDIRSQTENLQALQESLRRRTIAVISHPDAGKSTLTDALLTQAGAIKSAGATHGKRGAHATVSDWMQMEQARGISVSSAAIRFDYRDRVVNIVDTPGHADFSEDTYRVLSAVDAAVMLVDAAKGIETQTMKLFEVCRMWQLPIVTVINKWDRPGREPLELLDEILERTGMMPAPVNWPVGPAGHLRAMIDLTSPDHVDDYQYGGAASGLGKEAASRMYGSDWDVAAEEAELLAAEHRTYEKAEFLAGVATPVIFGAALRGVGVPELLNLIVDHGAPAGPRRDVGGHTRPVNGAFSGQVFKVQSGTDPAHHDRIAFIRVCSGRFVRGDVVHHAQTGRPFATKYAQQLFGQDRTTTDEAWPGDIVGLVNASLLRPGDTLYADEPVQYAPLPTFAPEHFAVATPGDTGRQKQFRRGLSQLDEEGVIQLLHSDVRGPHAPLLGAVGPMQFEVAQERMLHEFGSPLQLERVSYTLAQRTDIVGATTFAAIRDCEVVHRTDGTLLVLIPSPWRLARLRTEHPDITLEPIVSPLSTKGAPRE